MTIVTGKHKELLVELLIYYLNKSNHNVKFAKIFPNPNQAKIIINIKAQNEDGQWYINYYLNDHGNQR
jgi:hypothetical protein